MVEFLFYYIDHNKGSYADGLWHTLTFEASKDQINLVIDNKNYITTRSLVFEAGDLFYVGGEISDQLYFY